VENGPISNGKRPMRIVWTWLVAAAVVTPAWGDEALRQCRRIADTTARLACYDALPLPDAPARGVSAPAPPPVEVPKAAPAPPPSSFGLEKPAAPADESVQSTIPGVFDGWLPRQRFRLANGQVWQVADDTTGVYNLKDVKVTIKRGLFGGFVMEIDGINRVLRVRRVE
jgi:hypothetical protein